MEAAISERGYRMVSGIVPIDPRSETLRLIQSLGARLAGLAIQPYRPNRALAELLLTSPVRTMPHILIGHYYDDLSINSCVIDNYGGMYAVTELLIKHGRKRPAFVGEISLSSTEHERHLGFCMACLHNGIRVPPEHFVQLYHEQDLRARFRELLNSPTPPDSLICLFDGLVPNVFKALTSLGVSVPDHISVASFGNDMDIAEHTRPLLTTAHHPARMMGAVAAHQLINEIEGLIPPGPTLWVVPVSLVRAESCGTLPLGEAAGKLEPIPFSHHNGVPITLEEASQGGRASGLIK